MLPSLIKFTNSPANEWNEGRAQGKECGRAAKIQEQLSGSMET